MADTYTASSSAPDLLWVYDKATDLPVGIAAPDGTTVLFSSAAPGTPTEVTAAAVSAAIDSFNSGQISSAWSRLKPSGGIPKDHLEAAVRLALDAAATAVQPAALTTVSNTAAQANTNAAAAQIAANQASATAASALLAANDASTLAAGKLSQDVADTRYAPISASGLARKRGLAGTMALLNALAWAGGDTTSIVPAGDHNPTTFSALQTALASATSGQRIRIPPKTTIVMTAKLTVPVGVSIIGGGGVSVVSGFAPSVSSSPSEAMFQLTSGAEGTNGNQTIENISFSGNNYQAAAAVYVRGRSNVKVKNCEFVEFYYNAVTFSGRADETDGAASVKAAGNEFSNCAAVGCSTWIGTAPAGYASGVLQVGSQVGFSLRDSIIIAKGRGAGLNGYGVKLYRLGYNDGFQIDNCVVRKDCDDGTPSNFGFCCEVWNDTGLLVQNSEFEGWFDLNGVTKGSYAYGAKFTGNTFGTASMPTNTTTMAIELECGSATGGAPCSDIVVSDNTFRNVRQAMYIYQKAGTTARFARVTFTGNRCLNTRLGEYVAAVGTEGGTEDWKVVGNTFRRLTGAAAVHSGVNLPGFGVNQGWEIRRNIIAGFSNYAIFQASGAVSTSNVQVVDNVWHSNGSNTANWPVQPTTYTEARNDVVDPVWDAQDGSSMVSAMTGSIGADAVATAAAADPTARSAADAAAALAATKITQAQGDARYVRTVNNTTPDGAGNVTVAGGGASASVTGPDTSLTFSEFVARMPAARRDGYVFGTNAVGTDGARDANGRIVIKSRTTLAQHFEPQGAQIFATQPFQGTEFNAGGGWDFVCTSFTNQAAPAGSTLNGAPNESVFAFETDALRLQQVLQYGSHQTYLVGNVTAPGVNCNAAGGTTTTPIAAFGRVSADIANMNVGDIVTLYDAAVLITAKNQGAGTLTVEKLLNFYGSGTEVVSDTWRKVEFHRWAAARTTSPTAFTAGASGPFEFETPIPSQIVPGCTIALSAGPGAGFVSLGHTRIKTIDRTGAKHTITLERPIASAPYSNVVYVVMVPTVWTPQMATKAPQGPHDCAVYALQLDFTAPEVEAGSATAVYTGAEVNTALAAQPLGLKQCGAWYAAWFNDTAIMSTSFLGNGKVLSRASELDKPFELFPGVGINGNVWTGNVHARGVYRDKDGNITWNFKAQPGEVSAMADLLVDGPSASTISAQTSAISTAVDAAFAGTGANSTAVNNLKTTIMSALQAFSQPLFSSAGPKIHMKEKLKAWLGATRTRVLNAAKTGWRIPGSQWVDPAQGFPSDSGDVSGGVQITPGTHKLVLPTSHRLLAGERVQAQVVWTREWSICYVRGEPICLTTWDARDQEAPYTFIIDVLGHAVQGWAFGNGFYNRDTTHIADHWMKVHAIDIWRA